MYSTIRSRVLVSHRQNSCTRSGRAVTKLLVTLNKMRTSSSSAVSLDSLYQSLDPSSHEGSPSMSISHCSACWPSFPYSTFPFHSAQSTSFSFPLSYRQPFETLSLYSSLDFLRSASISSSMRPVRTSKRDFRTLLGFEFGCEGSSLGERSQENRRMFEQVRRDVFPLSGQSEKKLIVHWSGCSFTTAEKLPAQYDCAACGFSEQASKRLSIKALPQVLCVQLKVCLFFSRRSRPRVSATDPWSLSAWIVFRMIAFRAYECDRKQDRYIRQVPSQSRYGSSLEFDSRLSCRRKVTSLQLPKFSWPDLTEAVVRSRPPHPQRFNLMSVVAHEGSLSQGHYTTYVRGTDDVSLLPTSRENVRSWQIERCSSFTLTMKKFVERDWARYSIRKLTSSFTLASKFLFLSILCIPLSFSIVQALTHSLSQPLVLISLLFSSFLLVSL